MFQWIGSSFEIEWAADYDIKTLTELMNVPDKPMAFKFNDLKWNSEDEMEIVSEICLINNVAS